MNGTAAWPWSRSCYPHFPRTNFVLSSPMVRRAPHHARTRQDLPTCLTVASAMPNMCLSAAAWPCRRPRNRSVWAWTLRRAGRTATRATTCCGRAPRRLVRGVRAVGVRVRWERVPSVGTRWASRHSIPCRPAAPARRAGRAPAPVAATHMRCL